MNATNAKTKGKQKVITGTVCSTSMKDTVVVLVTSYHKHAKYGKFLVRSKRLKAHDKGNTCSVGDIVSIKQTKPISKDKHFIVVERKPSVVLSEGEPETVNPES